MGVVVVLYRLGILQYMKGKMKTQYLFFLIIGIIFISGCAAQEVSEPEAIEEVPEIEEVIEPVEEIPEEVEEQSTELEEVDVKTVPEDIIDKCSREFSPKFNAEEYYDGPLFDAHFHMPNRVDQSQIVREEGHDAGPESVLSRYYFPSIDLFSFSYLNLCFHLPHERLLGSF